MKFIPSFEVYRKKARPSPIRKPLAARLRSTANRQLPFKTKRADTIKASAPTN